MSGRQDTAAPPKVSERIAHAIDGADVQLIDDAGHMVIIEQPSQIAELQNNWFARDS